MGKLADRLRDSMNRGIRPLGFGVAAAKPPAPLMLIASVSGLGEEATKAETEGADAVLISGSSRRGNQRENQGLSIGKALVGTEVKAVDKSALEALAKNGVAFAVLTGASTPAASLAAEGIDLALMVDPDWSDALARGVEQLSVAAVIYQPTSTTQLSIYDQLLCTRIIVLTRKPVLVVLPQAWGVEALAPLQDAGVLGVIVPADAVATFRDGIKSLPAKKRPRDREEIAATLPHGGQIHSRDEDEEEEEDRAAGTAPVDRN